MVIGKPYDETESSKAAPLGGGSGHVRPGEISRSHCGVLLVDHLS